MEEKSNKNQLQIDSIAEALNVKTEVIEHEVKEVNKLLENVDDDYEYARGNLISTLESGNDALQTMLELASQSQHPRAFEVFATLMKTISETNKDLLDLSQTKQRIDQKATDGGDKPKTVNNNMFLGTTSDLQRILNIKRSTIDQEKND